MRKKVNIVHYWGGSPVVVTSKLISYLRLIEKCTENGWNNWLILSKKPDDLSLIDPIIQTGCNVVYQPRSKGNFDLNSILINYNFLRSIKCDVFHCYNDHTSPLIAAKLARVPVKIWSKLAMSSYYEKGIAPKGLQKLMLSTRVTGFCVDRILPVSNLAGKEIVNQVGFKEKIITVNVPVSLDRFIEPLNSMVREEFKFNQDDFVIGAVGHFVEVKGWDIAVDAFAIIHKSYPNSKLFLIGKKTSESFYQKVSGKIKEYNLSDSVVLAGNRSDIPETLKACDLFILPSRSEGTPASLIEAMAAGVPSIATSTGGIPEVINHNVNGLLFERDNPVDLAEKVMSLVSNEDLRKKFTKMGQKNLHKYSLNVYVENVCSHYQELLRKSNSVDNQIL